MSSLVYLDVQKMILSPVDSGTGASEPGILLIVAGAISVYMDEVVLPPRNCDNKVPALAGTLILGLVFSRIMVGVFVCVRPIARNR